VIERLAIVGVGLLGGSLAKAARRHAIAREIVGVGRDEGRMRPAVTDGTLDRITTDLAAFATEPPRSPTPTTASRRITRA